MSATTATTLDRPARAVSTATELRRTVAAEWTRLWTVRSTWWALAAAAALMLLLGFAFGQDMTGESPFWVPGEIAIGPAQFALYVLVMLPVTAEYATGAIRSTLQAVPRRGLLLAARSLVTLVVATVAAVVLALLTGAMAWIGLGSELVVDAGDIAASLGLVAVVVAAGSLLTIGFGSVLRSSAGTLTSLFLLLLVLPQLLTGFGIGWLTAIGKALPGYASLALLDAYGIDEPVGRSAVVLGAWVVAAVVGGAWSLLRRDAA